MIEDRLKVSGEMFKEILSHMDTLSRNELLELQAESEVACKEKCSPALYHIMQALNELARVELVNRDLMGNF
ncbi:MAG: hypothetical protein AAF462_00965 [Thermodesulfobacteriota bacterium]